MESNQTTCKKCNQVKSRILIGKYASGNNKYTDENGNLWSGKVCADCNKDRLKEVMRKKREIKKQMAPERS